MSDVFSKAILKIGKYHSPDGTVEVTPERLRHWEQETKRLQQVGYAIPSHFDHANEIELLEPIAMDVLQRGRNRSAQATVGRLKDFKVAPDGQSAEIILETLTTGARDAVAANAVYVSPVIFPEWKDGAGNVYRDVITSFDLVDHPVDYSQTSFVPAVRMGLSKPYLFSGIRMSVTTIKSRGLQARKKRLNGTLVRLGLDTEQKKKPYDPDGDGDDDSSPETDTDKDGGSGEPGSEAESSEPENGMDDAEGGYDKLDQVLDLLHEFGVTLPDDTSDEELVKHLRVALTALLRNKEQGMDDTAPSGTDPSEVSPQTVAPMIATMSLTGPAKQAVEYAERMYRDSVQQRIEQTLKTGRCTPAEADALRRQMGAVRLSLASDGMPAKGDVEKWLDARSAVPAGVFWTDEQRTQSAQKLSVVEPRTEWTTSSGLSAAEIDEAVKALT